MAEVSIKPKEYSKQSFQCGKPREVLFKCKTQGIAYSFIRCSQFYLYSLECEYGVMGFYTILSFVYPPPQLR